MSKDSSKEDAPKWYQPCYNQHPTKLQLKVIIVLIYKVLKLYSKVLEAIKMDREAYQLVLEILMAWCTLKYIKLKLLK